MDIIVRYSSQLQLRPDLISPVLEFFVGAMGIHSNESRVQLRSWYLFERYLVKVQSNIAPMSDQILVAFTDLLQLRVTAVSNPPIQATDSDSDNESEHDVFFDSQLYLFQAAGLLIALVDATKLEVAEALLQSLVANIHEKTRLAASDQTLVVNIHHTIMAIGDIAKGYDGAGDGSTMSRQSVGNRLFAPASEVILEALAKFEDSSMIRDAVRRLIPSSRSCDF
jgi:exportin-T